MSGLILYGHPFSSYTWKVRIALLSLRAEHEFAMVDGDHPENAAFVGSAGPLGKFPVLRDGDNVLFETTTIIEYLALHHGGANILIPGDPDAAIGMRMLDRVFDNYVMNVAQIVVDEHIRAPGAADEVRCTEAREKLERTYRWLESWLEYYPQQDHITLIECAAAPSLFYADWVHPIGNHFPSLQQWRRHLLSLPEVACCVDDARPYRHFFPPGAPERD